VPSQKSTSEDPKQKTETTSFIKSNKQAEENAFERDSENTKDSRKKVVPVKESD